MSLNKNLFKKLYQAHVYVGLFVAIHFCIFALSGLTLLFKDELQGEIKTEAQIEAVSLEQTAERYAVILQNMRTQYPHDLPLALFPDDHDKNILNARLGLDGSTKLRGARKTSFTLQQGREIEAATKKTTGFFEWMLELHRELFLGSNGKLYVGFVGFLYVFMLVSGFIIYGKFMKTRIFGDIRQMTLPKLIDLHKFAGVVTFGWSLVVGFSGVFLALNGLLIKLFQFQSLKHLSAQYATSAAESVSSSIAKASFGKAVLTALQTKTDYFISYVSFPNTEFGIPGHYLFLINGTTPLTEKISELVVVNAQTAKVAEVVQLPLYLKLVLLSEPLHFGDYGGIFLKIIWAIFTLASLVVVLLGVFSFFKKRSAKKIAAVQTTKLSNRPKWISNSTYGTPMMIATVTLTSLVTALFSKGHIANFAIIALTVPLLILLLARRKNG